MLPIGPLQILQHVLAGSYFSAFPNTAVPWFTLSFVFCGNICLRGNSTPFPVLPVVSFSLIPRLKGHLF